MGGDIIIQIREEGEINVREQEKQEEKQGESKRKRWSETQR